MIDTTGITLRLATPEDFVGVTDLAMEFSSTTPYNVAPLREKIEELVGTYLSSPSAVVLLLMANDAPVGLLIGVVNEFLLTRDLMASEIAWYVRPQARGHGHHLRKAFEYWAKNIHNVRFIHMSSLDTPAVNKYLKRQGYAPTEKAFVKDLRK